MKLFEEHIFDWVYKFLNRRKLRRERELAEDLEFREKMTGYDRNIEICVRKEYRASLKLEVGLQEEIKARKELLQLLQTSGLKEEIEQQKALVILRQVDLETLRLKITELEMKYSYIRGETIGKYTGIL